MNVLCTIFTIWLVKLFENSSEFIVVKCSIKNQLLLLDSSTHVNIYKNMKVSLIFVASPSFLLSSQGSWIEQCLPLDVDNIYGNMVVKKSTATHPMATIITATVPIISERGFFCVDILFNGKEDTTIFRRIWLATEL